MRWWRRRRPRVRRRRGVALGLGVAALLVVGAYAAGEDARPPGSTTAPTATGSGAPDDVGAPWPAGPAIEPVGSSQAVALTTADGRERTFHLYAPSDLPDGPVPLVLALHGGLGHGAQLESTIGLDGLAEANGFVVAYPDGIGGAAGRPDARTWNAGACCGPALAQGVDDVAFLRAVIEDVTVGHEVDPGRVYLLGHSNGGMMAYRMACEAADVVAGIGVVGASLEVEPCQPSRPVSVAAVHGEADANHPIDGGVGSGLSDVDYRPAVAGVEQLAAVGGCALGDPAAAGDLTVREADGCAEGTAMRWTAIAGASHAWPGGTGQVRALVGEPYDSYDATAELWALLAAHPRSG